ncbi:CHAT domain-containing protein [Streptomyces mirabilis]|uniref:CHAT domain-containing protein n=1 Tax=Streptomyces mirabilis TaxID=68239 RepID=UPI0035DACF59
METSSPTARPLGYVVVFESEGGKTDTAYSPFATKQIGLEDLAHGTVPHGLSRDMATALPGLWYCLHLPSTLLDFVDMPAWLLQAAQYLKIDHQILLIPIDLLHTPQAARFLHGLHRTLVLCPDDLVDQARRLSVELHFALPTAAFSLLSDESLKSHWQAIHRHYLPDVSVLSSNLALTRRTDLAPVTLPQARLARQMRWPLLPITGRDNVNLVSTAMQRQSVLATLARLEREGHTPESVEPLFDGVRRQEAGRLRLPVTLAAPGVAPGYSRTAYSSELRAYMEAEEHSNEIDTWSVEMATRPNAAVERSAIQFVTAHHAIATSGLGLVLPTIPPKAFVELAELEKHFVQGEKPAAVRRLLTRLNESTQSVWTKDAVETIKRASYLTVFSNFPLGLLTLPGDTAPLSARIPIAYRPLTPLTRTVQKELTTPSSLNLDGKIRVLIAECIPTSDPVGRLSRQGWKAASGFEAPIRHLLSIEQVETLTIDALREAVAKHKPHFLILSAHGAFRDNVAGVIIGDEVCLELGFDTPPPVVMLSACHVAPRGAGAIAVTDLLLREGVVAVLGTQIPVRVDRNAMIMARFIGNIAEELERPGKHATLLDLWHHVQTLNAVHDILGANKSLYIWGVSEGPNGISNAMDFMARRSVGRLRCAHIYEDTEEVLAEMADEQGVGDKVRNWFKRPGYVPESLFYLMAGRPDRIHFATVENQVSKHVPQA